MKYESKGNLNSRDLEVITPRYLCPFSSISVSDLYRTQNYQNATFGRKNVDYKLYG